MNLAVDQFQGCSAGDWLEDKNAIACFFCIILVPARLSIGNKGRWWVLLGSWCFWDFS